MCTHGANLGRFLTDANMPAIYALPNSIAVTRKDQTALNIRYQLAVSFLMLFFDFAHGFKKISYFVKALFFCLFCKAAVHISPFKILACRRVFKVRQGRRYFIAVKNFKPQLRVRLFVLGGDFKNLRYLNVALVPRLFCIKGVFVSRLTLAGICRHQVCFGSGAFKFHKIASCFLFKAGLQPPYQALLWHFYVHLIQRQGV